jgi:hypothetical protein
MSCFENSTMYEALWLRLATALLGQQCSFGRLATPRCVLGTGIRARTTTIFRPQSILRIPSHAETRQTPSKIGSYTYGPRHHSCKWSKSHFVAPSTQTFLPPARLLAPQQNLLETLGERYISNNPWLGSMNSPTCRSCTLREFSHLLYRFVSTPSYKPLSPCLVYIQPLLCCHYAFPYALKPICR